MATKPKQRYIIRMEDGELFPFLADWLKIPGMVEYDPAIHGFRSEIAAQMGLVPSVPTLAPAPPQSVTASEPRAGQVVVPQPAAAEPVAQEQASEPDLSAVFAAR